MFFSRITINARSADPDELVKLVKGNAYTIHQILWRLFPDDPDAKRDFLFRREEGNGWPYFYMVSKRQPQSIKNFIQVESKTYQPELSDGQPLGFSLRANPVITKKTGDGKKRVRHDVVMNAKCKLAASSGGAVAISAGELQHKTGIQWLDGRAKKLGFSFNPDLVRVFGYQQYHIKKHQHKKPIRFSVLDFNGVLTIADSDQFCQTLFAGVGPAKAFGCGLMLVRRI